MTFEHVVEDIKKLIGLNLSSIRPGSNITILEVDEGRNNLLLRTSTGTKRSRPLSELKIIWDEMQYRPAVHVDEALHGSGTSRNQPETILANLPYVEWLKVTNKKHIAYVGRASHVFGSLKQMNPIDTANTIEMLKGASKTAGFSTVVVCTDISQELQTMNMACKGKYEAVSQGIYEYKTDSDRILFVSTQNSELEPGTYSVIEGSRTYSVQKRINILGKYYAVITGGMSKFLIKQDRNN